MISLSLQQVKGDLLDLCHAARQKKAGKPGLGEDAPQWG